MARSGVEAGLRVPRGAWIMLLILIFFYILNAFDRTVLSMMVSHVKQDLHVSDGQIGLMLGLAFAVFYGLFGAPIGMLVDRYSRRLILFVGVAFWSLSTVACGFAQTFPQLLLARMMLGIGEAALMPAAHALLAETFPRSRHSSVMSIFYLGGVFGNSFSVAIGGALILYFSQYAVIDLGLAGGVRGWQMPFVLVGAIGVASAGLAFAFSEPPLRRTQTSASAVPLLPILRARLAILVCLLGTIVLYAMVLYGTVLWTPTYMARAFGWNSDQIGSSYAVVHLVGTGVGTVVAGMAVDFFFARGYKDAHLRVFLSCVLIGGPCGAAAFLMSNPYLFLALLGVLHLFGFAFAGYAAALIQAISPPTARGRMAALYVLASILVGSGLGPLFIGLLTEHFFADEAKLGLAIAILIGGGSIIAVFSAAYGLHPMRKAVALTEEEAASAVEAI